MKTRVKHTIAVAWIVMVTLAASTIAGCGGKPATIIGSWADESGSEVLVFEEDGTCSVPFTYDSLWWESCDNYILKEDGTLILSSSRGNIKSRKYEKTDSKDDALSDSGLYYLSSDELVIDATEYEK
jgi:hypothetical protein